MLDVKVAVMWVTLIIIAVFAGLILWKVIVGEIDISRLISEPTGDASMSRFQLLIFTFVVALSLFLIIASGTPPGFPDVPGGVLTLLGISASSYVVSKSIQFSKQEGVEDRPPHVVVRPAHASITGGETVDFDADVQRSTNTDVTWSITPRIGRIDADTGAYTAPPEAEVPEAGVVVMVQAQSVAEPSSMGGAQVHVTRRRA